jgi:hypothetical protein
MGDTAWGSSQAYFLVFREEHSLNKSALLRVVFLYTFVNNVFNPIKYHSELKEDGETRREVFIYFYCILRNSQELII